MDFGRYIHACIYLGYLGVVMPCDDSHLVNNWEEEARRYAKNADYWRTRAEQAEAELARLRADLRKVYEISRLVGSLDVRLALRRLLEKPESEPDCTCGYNPTPTQHRYFCPWREWWLRQKAGKPDA